MTRNYLTRAQKKWFYTNTFSQASILVTLIILSLTLQGVSGLAVPETMITGTSGENESQQAYNLIAPGFVFPNDIRDVTGMSMDINNNGVEDFIETNWQLYQGSELINSVITLTQPPSKYLIHELEMLGCVVNHEFNIIDALGVSIPVDKLTDVGELPTVDMVQNVHRLRRDLSSAVPLCRASQDILQSNGYSGINGEGVTIAFIDSGIDDGHSTFGGNRIVAFKDFWYGQDDLDPTDGMNAQEHGFHGTMVASCGAGSGSYKSPAPGAYIIAVSVDTTYDMLRGIEWCVNNKNQDFNKDGEPDGPDIISMSMGLLGTSEYMDNTAGAAMDNGVLFITSAGNYGPGTSTVYSPGTSPKVIAVGATNKYNKQISEFSSRGPGPGGIIKPDIVAPGQSIICAYPGGQWTQADGTSFSCPIVAGIAALILQYDPALDPYEVKDILLSSAEDLGEEGPDNTYGYGFVNAIGALDRVLKIKSLTASPSSDDSTVWEDTSIQFSVTTSGSNIRNYEWDFDNDDEFELSTTLPKASYTFTDEGIYEVTAKVINARGKSAEASIDVEITNRKPIAELEIDNEQVITYEDEIVKFNASKSRDTASDTNKLEFSWSFDGGMNYTNFSRQDKTFKHSFNYSQEYNVLLRVRDDNGVIDTESKTIVIQNQKPMADAGVDLIAFEGESVGFSGINTMDSKSDLPVLEYTWDFGDDTKGSGINITHTYYAKRDNQTFEVKLTVEDDDDEKDSAKIKVIIRNRSPEITMGSDKTGFEDEELTLTAVANDTINDRDLLRYKWIFDDGDETDWAVSAGTKHTYTMVGNYRPQIMVKDPKGAISIESLNITINNVPPEADFITSVETSYEDETIAFDASASFDTESDNEHLKYVWDFGDGTMGTGKTIEHRYYKSYKYSVILVVKDDDGAAGEITKRITVENKRPDAKLIIQGDEFDIGELIKFYGYKSSDTPSDERNLTYRWDFGDGKHTTGINATHKYSEAGEYTIRLRISDDDGETDEARANIIIKEKPEVEDMFTNPTIENNGVFVYTGVVIVVIFMLIILLSLLSVYRGKKSIFGKFKDYMAKSKAQRKEVAGGFDARTPPIDTGMTPEQEEFFKEMYGIHPREIMQQSQIYAQAPQQPSTPLNMQPMPMTMTSQPQPMNTRPGQTQPMQYPPQPQMGGNAQTPQQGQGMVRGMGMGMPYNQSQRMPPGSQPLLPRGDNNRGAQQREQNTDTVDEPMDEFIY
ncbi:PKD domain-containing protein [[Eubacterium] cellulosolvens]